MNRLVYSSATGTLCPTCKKILSKCRCSASKTESAAPSKDGIARVGRETAGRKGAGVTVVKGLALDVGALADLARSLKARCGTGGTVKDGVIELQGDKRDAVVQELLRLGYAAKRVGG